MSENLNPTPSDEPGTIPTSDDGPGPDSGDGSISPPQPTLEEMTARLARMEANVAGRSREAEEERKRRQNLEDQLETMRRAQQQPVPQPIHHPPEPSDEEMAKALNRAAIDGNDAEMTRILGMQRQKTVRESEQRISAMIGQASAFSQQQQSYTNYLTNTGLKPGSALQQKASDIEKEISDDIKFNGQNSQYWFTGGNQAWIRSIAAERAKSTVSSERGDAQENIRKQTSAGAGTESGARSNGAPPGKSALTAGKMYLTDEEKRTAVKFFGGSPETAHKKYWEGMDSWKREQRVSAGKAVV
jgi:hypothetical protein